MDIEGHNEPKQTITSAEKVIDLKKYESLPPTVIALVATTDYIVEKYSIQNPTIIEVGPIPTGYDRWEADHKHNKRENPAIRYIADMHPDWKLAALSERDIPQELKDDLLGPHSDLFIHDTGNLVHPGLSTDISYYDPEDDEAERYPKLIRSLGGNRPNIISGSHVFSHSGHFYQSPKLVVAACRLLPIGGFLLSDTSDSQEMTKKDFSLPSTPSPFDMEKNMKLITVMEYMQTEEDGYEQKKHVLIYQKVGDSISPAFVEKMKKMKERVMEWKAKGWKEAGEE